MNTYCLIKLELIPKYLLVIFKCLSGISREQLLKLDQAYDSETEIDI
jgi:hypothetical protein